MQIVNDHNDTGTAATPPPLPFIRQMRLGRKSLLLALQCGILMIGALAVLLIAYSRDTSNHTVNNEIYEQWGEDVYIQGPVAKRNPEAERYIRPLTMNCTASVQSQTLHRNIYETEVYNASVAINGTFDRNKLARLGDSVYFDMCLDPTQIVNLSDLKLEGRSFDWETTEYGLSACVDSAVIAGLPEVIRYSVQFDIRGSQQLFIKPLGRKSEISIEGTAANPSFQGYMLPDRRTVSDNGFKAVWTVNTQPAGLKYRPESSEYSYSRYYDDYYVGMKFLTGVTGVQKVCRSLKYAFLIIILTYLCILCAEVVMKREIGLLNYLLIGAALIIFYTLLLSFAEHMSFGLAYLAATVMTVLLITAYMYKLFGSRKVAGVIGSVITVLYICCFVLLSLETYALLLGSVLMFVLLAVIMYGSLKLPALKDR